MWFQGLRWCTLAFFCARHLCRVTTKPEIYRVEPPGHLRLERRFHDSINPWTTDLSGRGRCAGAVGRLLVLLCAHPFCVCHPVASVNLVRDLSGRYVSL